MSSAPQDNISRPKFTVPSGDQVGANKKPLPESFEAESALLGSMILNWRVTGDVLQIMGGPEDFFTQRHANIYEVLVKMYDEHQSGDMVQVKQRLDDLGILEQVGGVDYLIELAESVPHSENAIYYAKIVRDKSILRMLIEASDQIRAAAYSSADPVQSILDHAEQQIFQLAEFKTNDNSARLDALLTELYEYLQNRDDNSLTGVESGFFELDDMTNGLQKGELIILAARPSMGKTALAINIAEHMACDNKAPVLVFSLEMGKQQLAQRLMCSRASVDSQKLRRNMLGRDDFERLAMCVGELSDAPFYIDDSPGLTLLELRTKSRRMAAQHHIQAIVIDYLQLLSVPDARSREQEVSALSRGIKALARELEVPIICLSQLNRGAEQREGHRPRMSDLRESGAIEQDADVIMMLHREDYYHRGEENYVDTNVSELILAKQRNGPTGMIKLTFHGPTTRFHNLATSQGPY